MQAVNMSAFIQPMYIAPCMQACAVAVRHCIGATVEYVVSQEALLQQVVRNAACDHSFQACAAPMQRAYVHAHTGTPVVINNPPA